MIPDFFVSHPTSKTFTIDFLTVKETFWENPIIGTAVKIQYKFPLLRTLAVWTLSHSLMVSRSFA